MVCIYCGNDTGVINSRLQKRSNSKWRRRRCSECSSIFTSIETVDLEKSLVVVKRKAVEPFSREKLLISIYDSLLHRKTAVSDATSLSNTVISKLQALAKDAQIKREDIISTTSTILRRFDRVAATHYAAFHPL